MAEQTSSSIVIDAPPAAVMDVIADFPAYPEWAKGVKEATVRAEGAAGRAEEVFFALDVAPIKDEYTLAYTWNGDRDVSWTLAEGKMLRALDGAVRPQRPRRRLDRGHLPARARRLDPADRDDQAQGREDPHRHRAQGAQAARRVAGLSPTLRVLLFTGKGGVGKSTLAAGTAALAAAAGHRTLVLSTDAAHSLADALGCRRASSGSMSEPVEVGERLWVQQVDAQLRFEQSWADIQGYLLSVLAAAGLDPVAAEELTVVPGAEEVLALLELRLHAASGRWDVVVVDCAPTAETLRLLALPEALGWYIDRVLPVERRVVKALRPVLTRAAGVPMPADSVFDAIVRLHAELDEVRALLTGPERQRADRAHPRVGGARRGPPVVDHALALRLPRRRRGRQPGVPGRRRRRLAGGLGGRPGRRARRGRGVLRRAAAVALGVPAGRARRRGGPARPGGGDVRRRRPARRTRG